MYLQKSNGEHIGTLVSSGRLVPTFRAAARRVVRYGCQTDLFSATHDEAVRNEIDRVMSKWGFSPVWKITKSGYFYRLLNYSEWHTALRKEFEL